jgi:hypothetical protein
MYIIIYGGAEVGMQYARAISTDGAFTWIDVMVAHTSHRERKVSKSRKIARGTSPATGCSERHSYVLLLLLLLLLLLHCYIAGTLRSRHP